MFISKSLAKKIRHSASVLLHDGTDENGMPKVAVRQVKSAWGKFELTGRKGGVCFPALSDGITQAAYADILGYHTGKEAFDTQRQPLAVENAVQRLAGLSPERGRTATCFQNRYCHSYHSLKAHNHELLVLRQMVRKQALFRPLAGREESRPKANRSKRNHILPQDRGHRLFRPGIRLLPALMSCIRIKYIPNPEKFPENYHLLFQGYFREYYILWP